MNNVRMYDITPHAAEIYDQIETKRDDVQMILKLVEGLRQLRILEPFCGTGRILIPLALPDTMLLDWTKPPGCVPVPEQSSGI